MEKDYFVPSDTQMTSIVLPTILFCILMVVAMLFGINKCKQWDLDRIVEMRRTRRVLQRITARLREKNFKTIEKARNVRKQAAAKAKAEASGVIAPPVYSSQEQGCGTSPPPSYEEALLDQYYFECHPGPTSARRSSSSRRTSLAGTSRRRSSQAKSRRRTSTGLSAV